MSGRTPPLVRAVSVSRTYGSGPASLVAVHGSSCEVSPGQIVGIGGASGSGKSTLLHLLAGLEVPTTGEVTWPALADDRLTRRQDIGVIFQSPSLLPHLDIRENIEVPLLIGGLPDVERTAAVEHAIDALDLGSFAHQLPDAVSGGQAQRAVVARVLAQRPRLILADEPTGQLDHDTGRQVINLVLDTARRIGAALVVTSHDDEILAMLDERWQMTEGRLHHSAVDVVSR